MNRGRSPTKQKFSEKSPSWMITFADLMSLLLCFFVLLLSFSEMDREKFKIITGSLRHAFGVQSIEEVMIIPKGMDLIKNNFNDPTFVEEILKAKIRSAIRLAKMEGNLKLKEDEASVTVSFPDQVLFDTGSSVLKEEAFPILDRFREVIMTTPQAVRVVGHTDNVPIDTAQFPSNWELSSARAGAVIRHLLEGGQMNPERFTAVGCADTVPVASNDTPEDRAKNRRVELVFQKKVSATPLGRRTVVPRRELGIEDLLEPGNKGQRDMRAWPSFFPKKP
jgi:chemotaxis protein MotB